MPSRRLGALVAIAVALSGCVDDPTASTPDLALTPAEVNMCFKQVGDTYDWQGLQLESTGEVDLTIVNIEVRGDSSCAFQCFREAADGEPVDQLYPCPQESDNTAGIQMTIHPGEARFVRFAYTPSAAGVTDNAALVVTSDAESFLEEGSPVGRAAVALCGQGFEEDDPPEQDTDPDAGVECPICEPPDAGAPGCVDGYPEP